MTTNWVSDAINPLYKTLKPLLCNKNGVTEARACFPRWDVNGCPSNSFPSDSYFLHACSRGDLQVAKALLELGADETAKEKDGSTALINACLGDEEERAELVKWLLRQAEVLASIDDMWAGGDTALHMAAVHDNKAAVLVLLCFGADRAKRLIWGITAAMRAEQDGDGPGREEVAQLIRSMQIIPKNEWRPRKHICFPLAYREAIKTILILRKACKHKICITCEGAPRYLLVPRYPESCLTILPEELMQYLFVWITSIPLPEEWIF